MQPNDPSYQAGPPISIQLLGEARLMRAGAPWQGKRYDKVIALLAYLILEGERSHSREQLAALLWPSLTADAARTNLRQSLYYLRQFFSSHADALLHADRDSARFVHVPEVCSVDVKVLTEQFPTCPDCPTAPMSPPCERCLGRLKNRADAYQGELLAGIELADAPDFDVWLDAQRQSLLGRAFSYSERLRNAYEALGRLGPAIAYAQRCVRLEPWNEAGHREHMRLLAIAGQHGTAETLYDAYRDNLARDLNVEPEQTTHSLFEHIHKREIEPREEISPVTPSPVPVADVSMGRRQATILCCHIDQPTDTYADAPELLAQARSLCATILRRHAGHLSLGQGGFLYAYIGYPQASEHAGELAVQASLELQRHFVGRYRFRAGIHTGIILAGFDPALPDIVGDVTATAWRLCTRLQKSGIALSETTRALLPSKFDLEALKPVSIPGNSGVASSSVPVFKLSTPVSSTVRNVASPSPATELIGRKAELRRLKELWERACASDPQFLVISGEPGMGKTHLADALRRWVETSPAVIRHLHCYPEHQHSPLYPVIGLLRSVMDISVDATLAEQQHALIHYLEQHHPAIAKQAAPLLMSMLSIATEDSPVLSPRQRKLQTLDMLLIMLDSMALRHPLLLLIEDAQWLDVTSLDLLERLVHRNDKLALFTLVTARPEFNPSWLDQSAVLKLAPLKDEHIARLVRASEAGLSREAVDQIVRRADGIPLYAEQMARYSRESADEIPLTLHYLLLARLDTVPHARRLLQLAATLGRTFDKTLLQRISGLATKELDDALNELIAARLIAALPSGDMYQFHHALIQEAAYKTQIAPDLRAAHLKVARAFELHYAQRAAQQPGEMARHYTLGGDTRAALPWRLLAGRRALRVCAGTEAVDELQAGLALVPHLPKSADKRNLELELLLTLGRALLLLRGYGSEEAVEVYDRAMDLCHENVPIHQRFEIIWGLWMVSSSRKGSSFKKSWELTERLMHLAQESADPYLLAQAYSAATNISLWTDRLEDACRFAQAALNQPIGNARDASEGLDPRVTSLAHLSWALWRLGRNEKALAASRKSLYLARASDNPDTLCFALAFAAMLHRFQRNIPRAMQYVNELRRESSRHTIAIWKGVADMLLAWKQAYDRNPSGITRLNSSLHAIQKVMPGVAVMFFHTLAEAYGLLGRRAEQLRTVNKGLKVARQVDEAFFSSLLLEMRRERLAHQTQQ